MTTWSAEQIGNALIICDTCRAAGVGPDGQVIAVMTAITESSLINVGYGDRPASMGGQMSSSRGLFQQLAGWGPLADRMDPAKATGMFLNVLRSVPNWQQMPPWEAAQAVQQSEFADGSNYRTNYADAVALVQSYGTQPLGDSMRLTDLADVLRTAGLNVIELSGWQDRGESGSFNPIGILLHHDAMGLGFNSNPGDDMNVPEYMSQNGNDGSQLWVRRDGAWVVMAAGRKWHAGAGQGYCDIPAGSGNSNWLGVETDHTTGNPWPSEQLDSINRGCRTLAKHYGWQASNCAGHREYAPDRKIDPENFDLDGWRRYIASNASTPSKPATQPAEPSTPKPAPPSPQEDDMYSDADRARDDKVAASVKYLDDQFRDWANASTGQRSLGRLLAATLADVQKLVNRK